MQSVDFYSAVDNHSDLISEFVIRKKTVLEVEEGHVSRCPIAGDANG